MGTYDERLLKIAGVQHMVLGRDQLLEIGTARQIKTRLDSGFLERVYRGSYRVAHSPRTWRQDLMAGTFAGNKLSAGSFRAAAALSYLPGGEELVEITSQRHHRARHDGLIPHESRHLTDLDVMYIDNIPVTRTARTINDLGWLVANGELSARALDHAMHDAVRRGLVSVERVWAEWRRLGGNIRPSGDAVEAMLTAFTPPLRHADTSPELLLLQHIRAAGLPEPVPQFRVWLSPTWWVDLDFAWPWLKLFIEFDSYKFHGNRDKYMKDARRRLMLRRYGWDFVSVTDDELDAGCQLAINVTRALMQKAS